ncbi:DUF6773 family protein [Paenibacillus donghaensis]|uniref:DUF6773 family protein n=1 Tax=Paenibacillus donghaensis TaxID=414771 RepID=UPI002AD4DF8D|nr:DUF6773 family protein [Paenibacillus donghaensis]
MRITEKNSAEEVYMEGLVVIIIAISYSILRHYMLGHDREGLWGTGKKIEIWGKVLLLLAALPIAFSIIYHEGRESQTIKWFWFFLITAVFGFQAVIEWKFLKGYKNYIVSLIMILIGTALIGIWLSV